MGARYSALQVLAAVGVCTGCAMFTLADAASMSGRRASATVKRLAMEHVAELERKISEMQVMKATLEQLATNCHGDQRPDCPILDGLADAGGNGHCHA